jgi:uncharacterized protein YndB with AHSA1/START domain
MANPLQMLKLEMRAYQHIEEIEVNAAPDRVWKTLVKPSEWFGFDPDKSKWPKSSLKAAPGGLFTVTFGDGTTMLHGTVTYIEPGKLMRISGPFGLTHLAVNNTVIFELQPHGDGKKTLLRMGRRTFGYVDDTVEERARNGSKRMLGMIKEAAEASGKTKKGTKKKS